MQQKHNDESEIETERAEETALEMSELLPGEIEEADVRVELPDEVIETAAAWYDGIYGNTNPLRQNLNESIAEVANFQFETEAGHDAIDVLEDLCSWEPWNISCRGCDNSWSGKADEVPEAVTGFQPAEKVAGHWICLDCEELFAKGVRPGTSAPLPSQKYSIWRCPECGVEETGLSPAETGIFDAASDEVEGVDELLCVECGALVSPPDQPDGDVRERTPGV